MKYALYHIPTDTYLSRTSGDLFDDALSYIFIHNTRCFSVFTATDTKVLYALLDKFLKGKNIWFITDKGLLDYTYSLDIIKEEFTILEIAA